MRMSRDRRVPYVVIPLLLWYLLLFNSAWSEAKSDLDRFDLHGTVRTVVTKYPQWTTTHQFDRDGQLTALELLSVHEVVGA